MSKIVYFSFDFSPHDYRFLSALAETEHKVYYVRLQSHSFQSDDRSIPSNIEQVQWAGVNQAFSWNVMPSLIIDFQHITNKIKPHLVHAGPIQTCAFLTALSGYQPLLTMSWGFDLIEDANRNAWWRSITRYTLDHSTFFTSDCQSTQKKAVEFGMNIGHSIIFPWGVDLENFSPRKLGVTGEPGKDPFTLICTRAWEPRYGVDVLAKAFVLVAREKPDVNLILVGNGSQGLVIQQLFEKGDVSERVTFTGRVIQSKIRRYYHMADIYISPSHVDGTSVSLLEAMACGLPSLVSDIPANAEWISEGVNGWLFPDGDAEALAALIIHAIETRSNLKNIGDAARRTAEKKADWTKNFKKLLEAYDRTLLLHDSN